MTTLFNQLVEARSSEQSLQAEVLRIVSHYNLTGYDDGLKATAEQLAETYKQDKKTRASYVSSMRSQMARACKTLEIDKLTVKTVNGTQGMIYYIDHSKAKAKSEATAALQTAFNACKKTPNRPTLDAFEEAFNAYRIDLLAQLEDKKEDAVCKVIDKHEARIEEVRGSCKVS